MGLFAEWQPAYAEAGLITLPLDGKKRGPPGWNKMGLPRSAKLAADNDGCDVFGVLTGRGRKKGVFHPGVSVIDYDGSCPNTLGDLIGIHGQPGALVRTASGKFHLYYRNAGERRKLRIHGKGEGDPLVDLLGLNGYAVAPPSRLNKGCYEFLEGTLQDILGGDLPEIQGLRAEHYLNSGLLGGAPTVLPDASARNESLFRSALQFLAAAPDLQSMSIFLDTQNAAFAKPLSRVELDGIKSNAWRKHMEGSNGFAEPYLQSPSSVYDAIFEHSDHRLLLSIYMYLRRHSGARQAFYIANGMGKAIGCKDEKISEARKFFEDIGAVVLVSGHTNRRPAIYRWPQVPQQVANEAARELDVLP